MIYEYALEPELVASWHSPEDFRFFVDKFGLGRGRIITKFPKGWVKLVWESVAPTAGDMARKRLEELLMRFTERMIRRVGTSYDGNAAWLLNAESEHLRQPFHAILARTNPRRSAVVLLPDHLNDRNVLWVVKTDCVCARTAAGLENAIDSVLRCCSMVAFIDPNFGPENGRHRRPLREFLRVLAGRPSAALPDVELHTSGKARAEFFRETCESELMPLIPSGFTLRVKRWRIKPGSEALHHRYVLTDLGGVGFKFGLDDGATGETDELNLLSAEVYRLRWGQYLSDRPAFELVDELTITGQEGNS
jgi:hypothetical protein